MIEYNSSKQVFEKIFSLHKFGVKLGLENILKFLDYIGNPQSKLKCFHIAGTNGKGSTSSFVCSILMEAGYKVGLFTSPHYVKFNERIKINGEEINDDFIVDFMNRYNDFIHENKITFFEVSAAMAFEYFRLKNVDFAVIETGLGGRLDATNVLNPLAVIITSISLEHTEILGNSLPEIAYEKAAIIKNNGRVFLGKLPSEVKPVILNKCAETKSDYFFIDDYFDEDNCVLDFEDLKFNLSGIPVPLKGKYQLLNASLAVTATKKTLNIKDKKILADGLSNVIKNTKLQGRYEVYSESPKIIFDSAHNVDGIKNFINAFRPEKSEYSKCSVLFGAMKDKAIKDMLMEIRSDFDEFYLTEIDYERSCKLNDLSAIADSIGLNYIKINNPTFFVEDFKLKQSSSCCLVVVGSIYLLGQIKSSLFLEKTT